MLILFVVVLNSIEAKAIADKEFDKARMVGTSITTPIIAPIDYVLPSSNLNYGKRTLLTSI